MDARITQVLDLSREEAEASVRWWTDEVQQDLACRLVRVTATSGGQLFAARWTRDSGFSYPERLTEAPSQSSSTREKPGTGRIVQLPLNFAKPGRH